MSKLVPDPDRPGQNSGDRGVNRVSRKIVDTDAADESVQDAQLKQLKLIKTHMEVQNGEVLELDQNDDDDAGAH